MGSTPVSSEVLFLSYDGLTDPLGQSQILPYFTGLSEKGYSINIISFEKRDRFEAYGESIRTLCVAAGIMWYPQKYYNRPPVVSTLYVLFVLWRKARKIVRDRSIRIVHCRSQLTALIGLRLKREFAVKIIFDMRGFWADERIEGGIWPLGNIFYRWVYEYFKRTERQIIKVADHTIVLTQEALKEVTQWNLSNRIDVIPCCVDLDLFDVVRVNDTARKQVRVENGIGPDDFVLLYLGSLGTWYMVSEMISFYNELRKVRPDAKFLILTPDRDAPTGEGIIIRTVQRRDVPTYIAIANASICYIRPSFSKKGSSATKVAEVLALNVPVVANKEWGDMEFLESRVNGLILTSAGERIPAKIFEKPSNAQTEFFKSYFSLAEGVNRYEEVYKSLLR